MAKVPAQYEAVIGLEIHVQLATQSKMFCRCRNLAGTDASQAAAPPDETSQAEAAPNSATCPVCLGMPGTLPVPNRVAVEWALKTAMALGCSIPEYSKFDRKQYFYPDLPKGYQISQYDEPLGGPGRFTYELPDAAAGAAAGSEESAAGAGSGSAGTSTGSVSRTVGITRLHLEEDAGKLIHPPRADYSLVDLNRAGTPLMEIVTEPDLRTPAEAKRFLQELRLLMRYLGVSEAEMEKGHLRADANVSVRPASQAGLGTKTELKNLNSFKFVEKGLVAEIARQIAELEAGRTIVQETRGYDEASGKTVSQRSKEEANDYRYFPEPDLPSLEPAGLGLDALRQAIPELPSAKRQRFIAQYGLAERQAEQLVADPADAAFFEDVITAGGGAAGVPEAAAKLLLGPLMETRNVTGAAFAGLSSGAAAVGQIAGYLAEEKLDWSAAKRMLTAAGQGIEPAELITRPEYQQADQAGLDRLIKQTLAANPAAVEDFKSGNPNAANVLMGAVMKQAQGSVNPPAVKEAILKKLEG